MPGSEAAGEPLLEVRGLTVRFGGITALDDLSFGVAAGRVTGLIGPNGAGKTTCFNCITRHYRPAAGEVRFRGRNLLQTAPHRIVHHRIARTFQNVALFESMSVLENVRVGGPRRASEVLAYLGLTSLAAQPVGRLPFAGRKAVELARALAAEPELLLLDEPAAGLNADEVGALEATIRRIAVDFGTSVLMVEHHMGLVMRLCDHIVVLASGRCLAEGPPEAIRSDPLVAQAYLGTD
jgi:branched-chain amino acid transport system ATP-binding protein